MDMSVFLLFFCICLTKITCFFEGTAIYYITHKFSEKHIM